MTAKEKLKEVIKAHPEHAHSILELVRLAQGYQIVPTAPVLAAIKEASSR